MEYSRPVPPILWDQPDMIGDILKIRLQADHPLPHSLFVDREVLNDAFGATTGDLIGLARAHKTEVETAVANAWAEERDQELREVYTGQGFVRLVLELRDFRRS